MSALTGAEQLEVIAETICRADNQLGPEVAVEGVPCKLHMSVAVLVLDAIQKAEAAK